MVSNKNLVPVAFAGTAQNQIFNPNRGFQLLTSGSLEASLAIEQQLPVLVASTAEQAVFANPIGEVY